MESPEHGQIESRLFTIADADAVFEMRLDARKTDPSVFPTSYEEEAVKTESERRAWFKETLGFTPKHVIAIAKDGDKVVGMIGAREKETGTWNLHGVYVRPEYRSRRIGEDLMRLILRTVQERPDAKLITFEAEKKQTAAVEMYKKFGFEIIGETTQVMGDGVEYEKYIFSKKIRD